MSLEKNKEVVRKCIDAINETFKKRDSAGIHDVFSPELASGLLQIIEGGDKGDKADDVVITDMVAEGDKVWCRLATGAIFVEWNGIPGNGKHVTNPGIWCLRIVDGKVVELESHFDQLNILKQLGGIIMPPKPESV